MQRIWTTELAGHAGGRVQLAGWLHRLRRLSNVSFLVLRDARGLAQVVIEDHELAARVTELYNESVISVTGLAVAEEQAPGGVEVREPTVEVIAPAVEPPPFDLFRPALKAQLPTILDHAPLALRHPSSRAVFQLASASMAGFRATLASMGFVEVQTPKIVAAATESGASVFPVNYFGRTTYLAQSPQFYKQIMVGVYERVFEVGPVFRAEPHDTPRHLNEFVSLDVELGFIEGPESVMRVLAEVIRGMVEALREQASGAVALLGVDLPEVPQEVPAIHFAEAQELIALETGEDPRGEPDLAPAHERFLGEWARREHGSDFLFVTGYPMAKRPFYTHPDPERPGYSKGFDLIFRGQELVTGGQRLHLYADYLAALKAAGIDPGPLSFYLEAFKYGMPPHGGFAIGLERWVSRLIGASNIREATLFPRDTARVAP
ncbi:MAG: aspartate--tRNA(Asn) ligase [Chloroflexia bacterium]